MRVGVYVLLLPAVLGITAFSSRLFPGCSRLSSEDVVSPQPIRRSQIGKSTCSQNLDAPESSRARETTTSEPNEDDYQRLKTEIFWRKTKLEARELWKSIDDPDARLLKLVHQVYNYEGYLRPRIPDQFGNRIPWRAPIETQTDKELQPSVNRKQMKRYYAPFVKMQRTIRVLFLLLQANESALLEQQAAYPLPEQLSELLDLAEQESQYLGDIEVLSELFDQEITRMLKHRSLSVLASSIAARKNGLESVLRKRSHDLALVIKLVQQERDVLSRLFSEFCYLERPVEMQDFGELIDQFFKDSLDLVVFKNLFRTSRGSNSSC